MSASSKKKLRKEQNAAQLTEKQRKEKSEAKKLKAYTITFVAIVLVVAIVAASVMVVTGVNRSGIIDKNTVAATVNGHEISSVELSYYYMDLISNSYNEWYSTYGDDVSTYLLLMGLDLSKPLDQQTYDEEGTTWAQFYIDTALDYVKSDYALYDLAMAEGYTLSEDDQTTLDTNLSNLSFYALMGGYEDLDAYLVATYGFGASLESYKEYCERSALATSYYNAYADSLTYDDAAIRAYEEDKYDQYSCFTYASYYMPYTDYLDSSSASEDGTYSDEVRDAARAAVKADAESLTSAATIADLDKAIAALAVNADSEDEASTQYTRKFYSSVDSAIRDWVADSSRKSGDITAIPYESTTTDTDGNEKTVINGYYVVYFQERDDNLEPMANVRHLLVEFEGGTKDDDGNTTYSDAEKAVAKEEAEGYLKTWKDGAADQDSFIELVKEHSDDSSASTGGLFEDITPDSNYVENFLNWSIDPDRKAGDTDVIESEYGYHVMYYVGDDELTYRDSLITESLRSEDVEAWYTEICDAAELTAGDTSRIETGIVISAS